jgi:hypothetical protein
MAIRTSWSGLIGTPVLYSKRAMPFIPRSGAGPFRRRMARCRPLKDLKERWGKGKSSTTDSHFAKVVDLNADDWPDILIVGMTPGALGERFLDFRLLVRESALSRPRQGRDVGRHVVAENVGNFAMQFVDLFGDNAPVLLGEAIREDGIGGQTGYFEPDRHDATKPWVFHAISSIVGNYSWTKKGLGHGDVNGDGRVDVLGSEGWWEQPPAREGASPWEFHPCPFGLGPNQIRQMDQTSQGFVFDIDADGVTTFSAAYGSSQMYVSDLNADGLPDIVMSLVVHGYGLAWWEQLRERDKLLGTPLFRRHLIINRKPSDNTDQGAFSEMQAVAFSDIDNDGLKDIVTGKHYWVHGKHDFDREPNAPAVLYWLKQVQRPDHTVDFVPFQIDNDSGAGTQIAVDDIDGDGDLGIAVSNKKGAYVFLQKVEQTTLSDGRKRSQAFSIRVASNAVRESSVSLLG